MPPQTWCTDWIAQQVGVITLTGQMRKLTLNELTLILGKVAELGYFTGFLWAQ